MRRPTLTASTLLFFSGACALAYQTVWLRQFRLIFGVSTAATAAVLAIFMGGLGLGSALLGKRADQSAAPLSFYGRLEMMITVAAIASQILLFLVEKLYVVLGGSSAMGIILATIVRLVLATIVLGFPTFLMGGTLPAVARAIETAADDRRRSVAILYASNTAGAVAGTCLSTFLMLELFGNRATLLIAAVVNAAVGIIAWRLGRAGDKSSQREKAAAPSTPASPAATLPPKFVLAAAAVSGFAFLLMELVWYRMLGPILGGTTFTFGLILAVALLGIGLGGALYAAGGASRRATVGGFALTCTAEAALIVLPYAVGDRLAVFANAMRSMGAFGFGGHLFGWVLVTSFAVFPAALISGIQFPLLISLLGRGREDVGRDVGMAYAFNTAGAIAGSLAGGFGLIPLLSAPGCWRLIAYVLVALGGAAIVFAFRHGQLRSAIASAVLAIAAIGCTTALGPTSVWRHGGIGAGRAPEFKTKNDIRAWENASRRLLMWDGDGRESTIAVAAETDMAFVVNGKADGSATADAATQVMGGVLAAAIHPHATSALVVGLGTGSTAGWLASLPEMKRVDVVELEPLVLRVAKDFAAVNHDVMSSPKVHVEVADAREVLLTSREKYDIIFSEPSNPYRAGIASLFTREFYQAASNRLGPGGLFVQWVQAYEVDNQTVATIFATLNTVFPSVETWRGATGDLLLVAGRDPVSYDANLIRRRVATPEYSEPMEHAWRVSGAEAFFSHYIARDTVASTIARQAPGINTDDRPLIEFGFARAVGTNASFDSDELLQLAQTRSEWTPARLQGQVDWNAVLLNRATDDVINTPPQGEVATWKSHHDFARAYAANSIAEARQAWEATHFTPVNSRELAELADVAAESGDPAAETYAAQLRALHPAEADAVLGRLRIKQGRAEEAATTIAQAMTEYRTDPWPIHQVMGRTFDAALALARQSPAFAAVLYAAFEKPFAARQWDDTRSYYLVWLGQAVQPCGPATLSALSALEPWTMWRAESLQVRGDCYRGARLDSLARDAERDLRTFEAINPKPLIR